MGDDLDELDAPSSGRDPVVRMPRRMAPRAAPPRALGLRVVVLVGVAGAFLGALLGALGIGIVVATSGAPTAVRGPTGAVVPRVDAGPVATFELDPDAAVPTPPPPGATEYELVQQALGRGRTLGQALRAVGVENLEIPRVVRALRRHLPMRALRPGDRVVALRDPATHALVRVELRRSATQVWAATRLGDGSYTAEPVRLVVASVRVAAGFRVGSEVTESLRGAGLQPAILGPLAAALVAMDLPARLVGGDLVRVVVEEERLNDTFQRYRALLAVDLRGARGRRRGFWSEAAGDWFDAEGLSAPRGLLPSPVPGARLGARFDPARVHPISRAPRPHLGVDYIAPAGTPVLAAAAGIVRSASPAGASGNLVRLEHPALHLETGYAHLARFADGIVPGARVSARAVLGYVGSTGRSRAPHLHLTVRRGDRLADPLEVFAAPRPIEARHRESFLAAAALLGAALDRVAIDGIALAPSAPEPVASEPPVTEPVPEGDEEERPW